MFYFNVKIKYFLFAFLFTIYYNIGEGKIKMENLQKLKKEKADKIKSFVPTDDFLAAFITSQFGFEESDLSEEEVKKCLKNEKTSLKNEMQIAIQNEKSAFLKMFELAKANSDMDEKLLKDLHAILLHNLNPMGGLYRQVNISIKGSSYTPPNYLKVYDKMNKYFVETLNPFGDMMENISYAHLQLAKIRPFIDANGRLARIILNFHLIKNGFLPIIINHKESQKYFDLLEKFKVEKTIQPFVDFLKQEEEKLITNL